LIGFDAVLQIAEHLNAAAVRLFGFRRERCDGRNISVC